MVRSSIYRGLKFDISDTPDPKEQTLIRIQQLVSDTTWNGGLGQFLLSVNGGRLHIDNFFIDDDLEHEIQMLFSADEIESRILRQQERLVVEKDSIPNSFLPIGLGTKGELLCIERNSGQLSLLPHNEPYDGSIFIFETFDEMIDCLSESSD
ncbi:MAG: hypothetical protein KTR25_20935 [Myxococcales bacterium]|nr:hypothetical protein [Myxococcales bacterium]